MSDQGTGGVAPVRFVRWQGVDDPHRIDSAAVVFTGRGMRAHGASTTGTYALAWALDATDHWRTRTLEVSVRASGWSRSLTLVRDAGDGSWAARTHAAGETALPAPGLVDADALAGALDCDLGLCPVTNTMPIRRLELGERDVPETPLVMAWVEVPSLRVLRSDQVYASAGSAAVDYRSFSRDFHARLSIDDQGLVIDYPRLAQRLPSI